MPQNSPFVTDEALLKELNSGNEKQTTPFVTDPTLLNQLNGTSKKKDSTAPSSQTSSVDGTSLNPPSSEGENPLGGGIPVGKNIEDFSGDNGAAIPKGQIDIKNLSLDKLPENIKQSVAFAKKGVDAVNAVNRGEDTSGNNDKKFFELSLQQYPENIVAVRGLGDIAARQGNSNDALKYYSDALGISNSAEDLTNVAIQQNNIANTLQESDAVSMRNKSLENINNVIQQNPNNYQALELKAAILRKNGNEQEANDLLEKARFIHNEGKTDLLKADENGNIQFKTIDEIILDEHQKRVDKQGKFGAGIIDVPYMMESAKQGITEGVTDMYDALQRQLKASAALATGHIGTAAKEYVASTLQYAGGAAKAGISAIMVGKPIAGYTFVQGINAADEISNNHAGKILMSVLESYTPKTNSEIWERTKFLLDTSVGLALFHIATGGGKNPIETKKAIRNLKEGKPLSGEQIKNIADNIIEIANSPEEVKEYQDILNKIPDDAPIKIVTETAPLLKQKTEAEKTIQKLQSEKANLDENFQESKDKEIKKEETKIEDANTEIKNTLAKTELPIESKKENVVEGNKENVENVADVVSDSGNLPTMNISELEKGDAVKFNDGSNWTVKKIFDTSKVKDKLYQGLKKTFGKGEKIEYTLHSESSGSDVIFSEKQLQDAITPNPKSNPIEEQKSILKEGKVIENVGDVVGEGNVVEGDKGVSGEKVIEGDAPSGVYIDAELYKRIKENNPNKPFSLIDPTTLTNDLNEIPDVRKDHYKELTIGQSIRILEHQAKRVNEAASEGLRELRLNELEGTIKVFRKAGMDIPDNILELTKEQKALSKESPIPPKVSETQQPKPENTTQLTENQKETPPIEQSKEGVENKSPNLKPKVDDFEIKLRAKAEKLKEALKSKAQKEIEASGGKITKTGFDHEKLIDFVVDAILKARELGKDALEYLRGTKEYQQFSKEEQDLAESSVGDMVGEEINEPPKEIKIAADEKSMMKRLVESDNVSDKAKEILNDEGLKYKPHTHEDAREIAHGVVKEFGEDEAIQYAESNRFHGDVNSAIYAEAIDSMAAKEINTDNPKLKLRYAKKWAEYAIKYDEAARSKGRFISQIYDFYKKSPLGIVLKAEKTFEQRADQIIEPRKQEVKSALKDLIGTPEFEAYVKERIADAIAAKKGTRKAKVDRFFDKLKIDTKGNINASIVPPQIWNGAIEVMRKAAHAGLTVAEIVERGIAHINANYKEGWEEDNFRKEYQQKISQLEKETRFDLTEDQKQQVLEKWRKKLKGLKEEDRKFLLSKAINHIVENGGLEYDDFKKMYSEALGLPKMTDELRGKLMEFGKQINDADKAALDLQKERTGESLQRFDAAIKKSEEASRHINDLLGGEKHPLNTMLTMMRLNTLTPISLIANPIYNLSVLPLRGLTSLSAAGIDPLLSLIPKLKDTGERRTLTGIGEYVKGAKLGAAKSVRQFFTGLSDRDYFQKEVKQNIKPFQAMRNIKSWVKGEKKSTLKQKINDVLEASPLGMIAEIHARGLNIGDKGFRYGAEYQMAEQIAREKGLNGIDKEIFKRLPDETSKERIKEAGEKAILAQDNFISNLQKQYQQAKEKTLEKNPSLKPIFSAAEIATTATQPFLKIPLNAAIFSFEMSMPELMLVKGLYDAGIRGDRKAATTALSKAATGFAIRYVATQLAKNGIITADEDKNRERRGIGQYLSPYSMNFSAFRRWATGGSAEPQDGDIQVNLNYFGSLGNLFGQAAELNQDKKYAKEQGETWSYLNDLISRFSYTVQNGFEQGVFRGTSSLLQGVYNGSWDAYLTSAANVVENTVAPAEVKLLSQLGRDTKPDFGAMDTWDKLGAQTKLRFFGGKNIPADVNIWGEDMSAVPEGRSKLPYYFFDVTKYATVDDKQFGTELRDLYTNTADPKVFPNEPMPKVTEDKKTIKLTPDQYHDFKKIVGQQRKQLTSALFHSEKYKSASDEEKIKLLNKQYDTGYDEGKNLFEIKYNSLFPKSKSTTQSGQDNLPSQDIQSGNQNDNLPPQQ